MVLVNKLVQAAGISRYIRRQCPRLKVYLKHKQLAKKVSLIYAVYSVVLLSSLIVKSIIAMLYYNKSKLLSFYCVLCDVTQDLVYNVQPNLLGTVFWRKTFPHMYQKARKVFF